MHKDHGIFDDRVLFQALTLTVGPGELLQVAGDNGAGKTSAAADAVRPGASGKRYGELAGRTAGERARSVSSPVAVGLGISPAS